MSGCVRRIRFQATWEYPFAVTLLTRVLWRRLTCLFDPTPWQLHIQARSALGFDEQQNCHYQIRKSLPRMSTRTFHLILHRHALQHVTILKHSLDGFRCDPRRQDQPSRPPERLPEILQGSSRTGLLC
jgi:hypothetical protein